MAFLIEFLLVLPLAVSTSSLFAPKGGACPAGFVPWPASNGTSVVCQAYELAVQETTSFLKENLPPFDKENIVTLFGEPGGVDGLNMGVASVAVNMSLDARINTTVTPWAQLVPKDIFNNFVVPYANLNEGRTNARALLAEALFPILRQNKAASFDDAIGAVNGYGDASFGSVWTALSKQKIYFKSSQTPLIYDPMSVIAFGYASCTGVSVMLVDALRAVGVPARVVGTPAWHNKTENGNHNWIEAWRGAEKGWAFIEAKPAGQGETLDNPCDKWFCNKDHFPVPNDTPVYAAQFDRSSGVVYPMAWDPENEAIPGVDRTAYYAETCSKC